MKSFNLKMEYSLRKQKIPVKNWLMIPSKLPLKFHRMEVMTERISYLWERVNYLNKLVSSQNMEKYPHNLHKCGLILPLIWTLGVT